MKPPPENQGCEIEAKGINYTIRIPRRSHPLKIWSREEDEGEAVNPTTHSTATTTSGSNNDNNIKTARRNCTTRRVLKNVSCHAKPRELLAVVGPSGAGKSTLLEILAGKLTPTPSATPPTVLINSRPVDRSTFRRISGFVPQRDSLFPLLTVRETLLFSASLRLGCAGPGAAKLASRADALLRELGLAHVAEARVGDGARVRGVSGGERRRVSIGVELVHDPKIVILDEPTSGLDSLSAQQIVEMLKSMAESRARTIILSIHQPSSQIVKLFNSILLLADGSVLHHGSLNQLASYLSSDLGLEIPPHVNTLEFAIDSIDVLFCQIQHQTPDADHHHHHYHHHQQLRLQSVKRDRCTLQQLFQQHKVIDEESLLDDDSDNSGGDIYSYEYANSRIGEVGILAHRFYKNVSRTRQLFACRTVTMLVSGLVLGSIFYRLDDDDIRERVGLFAFILTFLLSCTTEALPIFLQEREILMKETSCGSYRVSSYVVANGLVFLPFLLILAALFTIPLYWLVGLNPSPAAFAYFLLLIWLILYTANSVVVCFSALAPNFIVGNSIIAGVMGSFFLFSGYFITKKNMPSCWVFMHYVSLFKYPFEGFLVNEFMGTGKCVVHELGVCVLRGEDVLREEGLGEGNRWKNVVIMVGFILVYRFFSYIILRCRCRCAQKGGLRRALASN
ncbi:ABC transporter G family member 5 [Typha angustifolia]|uniref:ABC transporter G family member 5 n=1 Tax=Typha angustifolia TaxID=59011 RepID=UPI003C2C975D